jgi:2-amino-4-hydroxy-6-hydroxymethyldihydropteridine diphosphokinase
MPEPKVDVYVGLGSNLNDPIGHVTRGLRELARIKNTEAVAHSCLYASAPMGPPEQPHYINAVAHLRTALAPLALLDELSEIEQAHGRVRGQERWGPRTLDLDILLYGDREIRSETLIVPHAGLHERAFVLYPLQELAGNLEVPGRGPLRELVQRCPRGELRKLDTS